MLIHNTMPSHDQALADVDRVMLGKSGADSVGRFLARREGYAATPLVSLSATAGQLGVASIHIKDEGHRLGLGSFKALGGAYAVVCLAVEAASKEMGREIDVADWQNRDVRDVASRMTVACATDGNHGRSVAQGAQLVGAQCVIFVHAGVTQERADAIAAFGARIVRVDGNYDDSVEEASRVAEENGWIVVSDTSWPGYERIPHLVMQGYTAMLREAVEAMLEPPTHVFIQAGVGGVAASVSAYFAEVYGERRPFVTVVDPARAACLFESARAGEPVKVAHGQSTVMAMLECYEPSLVAWRVLSRVADAFMTIEEDEALTVMRQLARPTNGDPVIVAGESGGVGLAALAQVASERDMRSAIGLDASSRVFLINTEGATDPALYERLIGATPEAILAGEAAND